METLDTVNGFISLAESYFAQKQANAFIGTFSDGTPATWNNINNVLLAAAQAALNIEQTLSLQLQISAIQNAIASIQANADPSLTITNIVSFGDVWASSHPWALAARNAVAADIGINQSTLVVCSAAQVTAVQQMFTAMMQVTDFTSPAACGPVSSFQKMWDVNVCGHDMQLSVDGGYGWATAMCALWTAQAMAGPNAPTPNVPAGLTSGFPSCGNVISAKFGGAAGGGASNTGLIVAGVGVAALVLIGGVLLLRRGASSEAAENPLPRGGLKPGDMVTYQGHKWEVRSFEHGLKPGKAPGSFTYGGKQTFVGLTRREEGRIYGTYAPLSAIVSKNPCGCAHQATS